MVRIVLMLGLMLATGCVGGALFQAHPYDPAIRWSKDGGKRPEFLRDRYECLQGAQQQQARFVANRYAAGGRSVQVTDAGLFVACMEARGYVRDDAGPFAPSSGSGVQAH